MKKKIMIGLAMLLVVIMSISLVACGGNNTSSDENVVSVTKDDYVGTWKRIFFNSDNECVTQIVEIYKGGTGHFTIRKSGESDSNYNATWELNDDVLNFTYSSVTIGLELDIASAPHTLIRVDDDSAIFEKIE